MIIVDVIKDWYANRKLTKILKKSYEEDEIILKLSETLGTQFRVDWVSRLYAVFNPFIKDGKWDVSQAFEYTEQGYDTTEHVKNFILGRLRLIENFIRTNNLFDCLTYDIKKLDDQGNYLFVIIPITLVKLTDSFKKFFKFLGWFLPVLAIIALTIFYFI